MELKSLERKNNCFAKQIKKIKLEIDKKLEINPRLEDLQINNLSNKEENSVIDDIFDDLLLKKEDHFKLCLNTLELFTKELKQFSKSINPIKPKTIKLKQPLKSTIEDNLILNISSKDNLILNISPKDKTIIKDKTSKDKTIIKTKSKRTINKSSCTASISNLSSDIPNETFIVTTTAKKPNKTKRKKDTTILNDELKKDEFENDEFKSDNYPTNLLLNLDLIDETFGSSRYNLRRSVRLVKKNYCY